MKKIKIFLKAKEYDIPLIIRLKFLFGALNGDEHFCMAFAFKNKASYNCDLLKDVRGDLPPPTDYSKVISENPDGSFTVAPASDGSIYIACLPHDRPLTRKDIEGR